MEFRYERVVVCENCKGRGWVEVYDDRERCYNRERCETCGGKRVLRMKAHVMYERVDDEGDKCFNRGVPGKSGRE